MKVIMTENKESMFVFVRTLSIVGSVT